jgi:hypothetical protein
MASAPAWACGQTTHVWTALAAVDRLPAGPLHDLVGDPALHGALVSGAMFPDGGYSPFVQHDYGETSHWETFHVAYAQWIVDTFPDLDDDLARSHQAFLLGLVAHGIGDQYFDAAYLERSKAIDTWGPEGADTGTDVVMGGLVGGLPPNDHWVPYDDLVPIFAEVGVSVDRPTMEAGMDSLDLAVAWVADVSQDPTFVALYADALPWATGHLLDADVPGSPETVADAIAAYWQAWWARLRGGFDDDAFSVLSGPVDGSWSVPHEAEGRLGLVSLVFGKAIERASLDGRVSATANGVPVEVDAWMYYGEWTNVADVEPADGWPDDAQVEIRVEPGLVALDGWVSAAPIVTRFHTGERPVEPTEPRRSCGTVQTAAPIPWLLALAFTVRRERGSRHLRRGVRG